MTRIAAALILAACVSGPAAGQRPQSPPAAGGEAVVAARLSSGPDTVRLELSDGTTLYGRIDGVRGGTVRVALLSGDVLEVQEARVRAVSAFEGRVVDGEAWEPDPNQSRLFFAPTARSVQSGSGYVAMYYAMLPFVAVGVGERVTLAGGAPLMIGPDMLQIFWLAPKVEVLRREGVRVAVGALSFFVEDDRAGVLYSVATLGSTADAAVTVGAGYGYANAEVGRTPALLLGGERRVKRGVKLMTENYLFPGEGMILSAGPRFIGERLTADLAMMTTVTSDGVPGVGPFVNFVWNW